jgi:hypothetical protein
MEKREVRAIDATLKIWSKKASIDTSAFVMLLLHISHMMFLYIRKIDQCHMVATAKRQRKNTKPLVVIELSLIALHTLHDIYLPNELMKSTRTEKLMTTTAMPLFHSSLRASSVVKLNISNMRAITTLQHIYIDIKKKWKKKKHLKKHVMLPNSSPKCIITEHKKNLNLQFSFIKKNYYY